MAVKEVSQALAVEQQITMWPVPERIPLQGLPLNPDATPLRSKTEAGP